jgi:hypothetical protein
MARNSVTPPPKYQLHPLHRAAILAASDSAKRARKIEQQRQRFIEKNGNDGTHWKSHLMIRGFENE